MIQNAHNCELRSSRHGMFLIYIPILHLKGLIVGLVFRMYFGVDNIAL